MDINKHYLKEYVNEAMKIDFSDGAKKHIKKEETFRLLGINKYIRTIEYKVKLLKEFIGEYHA